MDDKRSSPDFLFVVEFTGLPCSPAKQKSCACPKPSSPALFPAGEGRRQFEITDLSLCHLSQRFVAEIQKPSCVCSHLAITESKIDAADVNSAAANLENDRVFAVGRLLQHGLFHERVRVAAGDKVDAVNLRRDLSVAHLVSLRIRIIAKM